MPVNKLVQCFTVDELSGRALDKAYEEWLHSDLMDDWWYDTVYGDFKEIAKILGIHVTDINFSGFGCQGDGARFIGSYEYRPGAHKKIKEYAPQDEELHRIANDLLLAQRPVMYRMTAEIEPDYRTNYVHEHTVTIKCMGYWRSHYLNAAEIRACEGIQEALTDLMHWLYGQLEDEYEYLTSEERFREDCKELELLFEEDGSIFRW
jgi:hypothetical protein